MADAGVNENIIGGRVAGEAISAGKDRGVALLKRFHRHVGQRRCPQLVSSGKGLRPEGGRCGRGLSADGPGSASENVILSEIAID